MRTIQFATTGEEDRTIFQTIKVQVAVESQLCRTFYLFQFSRLLLEGSLQSALLSFCIDSGVAEPNPLSVEFALQPLKLFRFGSDHPVQFLAFRKRVSSLLQFRLQTSVFICNAVADVNSSLERLQAWRNGLLLSSIVR